jgi:hypothetical protein
MSSSQLMQCPDPTCGAILPVIGEHIIPHQKLSSNYLGKDCGMSGKKVKKAYILKLDREIKIKLPQYKGPAKVVPEEKTSLYLPNTQSPPE